LGGGGFFGGEIVPAVALSFFISRLFLARVRDFGYVCHAEYVCKYCFWWGKRVFCAIFCKAFMVFIETTKFTRKVVASMTDAQLAKMQDAIKQNPNIGELIKPNLCGLRKLRVADGTKGKRGGFRVIYFWMVSNTITLLLDLYHKSEKEDMTQKEMEELCSLIKEMTNGKASI
jgi:mRNA-degrading endonuclease RelE of RelBE toxin-antitoxin system